MYHGIGHQAVIRPTVPKAHIGFPGFVKPLQVFKALRHFILRFGRMGAAGKGCDQRAITIDGGVVLATFLLELAKQVQNAILLGTGRIIRQGSAQQRHAFTEGSGHQTLGLGDISGTGTALFLLFQIEALTAVQFEITFGEPHLGACGQQLVRESPGERRHVGIGALGDQHRGFGLGSRQLDAGADGVAKDDLEMAVCRIGLAAGFKSYRAGVESAVAFGFLQRHFLRIARTARHLDAHPIPTRSQIERRRQET